MTPAYAEIGVTTNFSFLRGASHPSEFAAQASLLGYKAIGIADRNTLAGVVRMHDALKQLRAKGEYAPKQLIGARLVFVDGTPDILAYPTDRKAYGRLCRLLSSGKLRAPKGDCILTFEDLVKWQEGLLLIILPSRKLQLETPTPKSFWNKKLAFEDETIGGVSFEKYRKLQADFGHIEAFIQRARVELTAEMWLGVSMHYHGDDRRRLKQWESISRRTKTPLIATNDALYHEVERRELQDIVSCIREGKTLKEAGHILEENAERHLKPPSEMTYLFRDYSSVIFETVHFADKISFSLNNLQYNYPDEPVPKHKTAQRHLEDITWEGAKWRYPNGIPSTVRETLQKELSFIGQRNLAPYFLTVHDIVRFSASQDILCQGRGSAANSAVCYMLGITAVDPTKVDLLFERFISLERDEPPDIDVDFEHERREEIIQEIYRKYGHARAALTATVIHYRPRSAIRETCKVFGLSEDVAAALASGVWGSWGSNLSEAQVRQGNHNPQNVIIARAIDAANKLIGFPRHLSQHVGGFVLTKDRLDEIVPISPATMEDRFFIEWDKDDLDQVGLMKIDVLALGMLTCIRKAFDLIYDNCREAKKKKLTLADVPPEQTAVYKMLQKADAIGVFQVESRAQMSMLPRLKPKKFYDLVVEVAIVRPGPIQGNMVHPYLKRRENPDLIKYPMPAPEHGLATELESVLGKTCGVPLFQEQAMKLAIIAAEFTADEANQLRRSMATFRNVGTIGSFEKKWSKAWCGGAMNANSRGTALIR